MPIEEIVIQCSSISSECHPNVLLHFIIKFLKIINKPMPIQEVARILQRPSISDPEFYVYLKGCECIKFSSPGLIEFFATDRLAKITNISSHLLSSPRESIILSSDMDLTQSSLVELKKLIDTSQVIAYTTRDESVTGYYWNDLPSISKSDLSGHWFDISLPTSREELISKMQKNGMRPLEQLALPLNLPVGSSTDPKARARRKAFKKNLTNLHLPDLFTKPR